MATTTPNFGWPVPTSTDLVKDGATAIEALGDSIDASLLDLKGGTTGQVLAKASGTDMDFSWVAQDDSNAIQNAIVDAKGDLIAASAADTPARLAVGNNGESLVADSSTSTGLRYQGLQTKNYQINGGFDNWQRSTSSATLNAYATADRWYQAGSGTVTYSRETDVPSNQGFTYSAKWLTGASSSFGEWYSALESQDVNALAGRAVTLSYWIKSSGSYSGTVTMQLELGNTANTLLGGTWTTSAVTSTVTPTGTWTRYQATGTITAGTVGLRVHQALSSAQATAIGLFITGIQIELGSVATTFTRAGGTLQGELAACQRYFIAYNTSASAAFEMPLGMQATTTTSNHQIQMPVTMRTMPSVSQSAIGDWTVNNNINQPTLTSSVIFSGRSSVEAITIQNTWSGVIGAIGGLVEMIGNKTAARYFLSSEL